MYLFAELAWRVLVGVYCTVLLFARQHDDLALPPLAAPTGTQNSLRSLCLYVRVLVGA